MNNARALIKWPGSKWRMAKWVIQNMPPHDLYCEPYCGSAAVFFTKGRSLLEVLNDKNWDLHNFFLQLRERPDELIWAIKNTPYSYSEWEYAKSVGAYFALIENRAKRGSAPKIENPRMIFENMTGIERARLFYVRCQMSILGEAVVGDGFRRQKIYSRGKSGKSSMKPAAISWMETEHIMEFSRRLQGVTLENSEALDILTLYGKSAATLFYVDPPYLGQTRSRRSWYLHEEVTKADHTELLEKLQSLNSMVLLAGYQSKLYDSKLIGWERRDHEVRTNGGGKAVESLWLNQLAATTLEEAKKAHRDSSPPRLL